jgi:hypothetical protein
MHLVPTKLIASRDSVRKHHPQHVGRRRILISPYRFIITLPHQPLNMNQDLVFRTPLVSVPAYKCLLKPTQMRAHTKAAQRKHLTAQYVSRLLSVYKSAYPDPQECIRMALAGVHAECQTIQEGMTHLEQLTADIAAAEEGDQTVCEFDSSLSANTPIP